MCAVITELDEALGELEDAFEAAILRVRGALKRDEEDKEVRLGRVEHQVSLLAAVSANHRRCVVDAVVHFHIVEGTAVWDIEKRIRQLFVQFYLFLYVVQRFRTARY